MKTVVESMNHRAASDQVRSRAWRRLRFGKSEEGAALVELALVMSLILTPLFLSMVQLGRVYYCYIEVKNAAAAGAEYGAENSLNYTSITGMENAATREAQDITMSTGYPTADYRVCTDSSGSPTSCVTCTSPSSCVWPAAPNSIFVDVHTKATVSLIFKSTSITMTGYATMRAQ
jgi:Flp pilus assembly protein TadG